MRREERQQSAFERDLDREVRTADEQIAILNERLGVGVGAVRERRRLGELTTLAEATESPTVMRKRTRRGK